MYKLVYVTAYLVSSLNMQNPFPYFVWSCFLSKLIGTLPPEFAVGRNDVITCPEDSGKKGKIHAHLF